MHLSQTVFLDSNTMSIRYDPVSNIESRTLLETDDKPTARRGICAPCVWFKEKPHERWAFIVMLLFGILTPVWAVLRVTGSLTGDILSGISALIFAVYSAKHFRILLGLKKQVWMSCDLCYNFDLQFYICYLYLGRSI